MSETHVLSLLPERFCICRLPAQAALPGFPEGAAFHSVTRTGEELSIVCVEKAVPPEARVERGFSCLKLEGPFDLGTVGVLARLSGPLAQAGVSIFVVSTFDTDYLLVRETQAATALRILEAEGHQVKLPQGVFEVRAPHLVFDAHRDEFANARGGAEAASPAAKEAGAGARGASGFRRPRLPEE